MLGFHEGAVRVFGDIAQMREPDLVGETARDGRYIVLRIGAERA
jgi:hypothetical protein